MSSARNSFMTFIALSWALPGTQRLTGGGGRGGRGTKTRARQLNLTSGRDGDQLLVRGASTVLRHLAALRSERRLAIDADASEGHPWDAADGAEGEGEEGLSPLVAAALFLRQSAGQQGGTGETTCRVSSQTLQALSEPPECQTLKKNTLL